MISIVVMIIIIITMVLLIMIGLVTECVVNSWKTSFLLHYFNSRETVITPSTGLPKPTWLQCCFSLFFPLCYFSEQSCIFASRTHFLPKIPFFWMFCHRHIPCSKGCFFFTNSFFYSPFFFFNNLFISKREEIVWPLLCFSVFLR